MRCLEQGEIYMEYREIELRLERKTDKEGNEESIVLFSEESQNLMINLSEESIEDIKIFFNAIFDYIVSNEKLVRFKFEDSGSDDLYHRVSNDIVNQINSEISSSEDDLQKIIELNTKVNF